MKLFGVDFTQKDKQGHLVAGMLIGGVLGLLHPALGLVIVLVVGYGKELLDKRDPENHTYDLKDAYATWLGGLLGVLLSYPIHALLMEALNG